MTFPDYLAALNRANPATFAAKRIMLTPESLIAQLRYAYQVGQQHERERATVPPDFLAGFVKGKRP